MMGQPMHKKVPQFLVIVGLGVFLSSLVISGERYWEKKRASEQDYFSMPLEQLLEIKVAEVP